MTKAIAFDNIGSEFEGGFEFNLGNDIKEGLFKVRPFYFYFLYGGGVR